MNTCIILALLIHRTSILLNLQRAFTVRYSWNLSFTMLWALLATNLFFIINDLIMILLIRLLMTLLICFYLMIFVDIIHWLLSWIIWSRLMNGCLINFAAWICMIVDWWSSLHYMFSELSCCFWLWSVCWLSFWLLCGWSSWCYFDYLRKFRRFSDLCCGILLFIILLLKT